MKRIVFVCVENSNRSQMAEAFARMYGGVEAYSAGSRPSGKVNPKAIAAMQELDYDLAVHQSKSLADLPDFEFDAPRPASDRLADPRSQGTAAGGIFEGPRRNWPEGAGAAFSAT
jgi:hypothetical protein